jgi:hypothetical protein
MPAGDNPPFYRVKAYDSTATYGESKQERRAEDLQKLPMQPSVAKVHDAF